MPPKKLSSSPQYWNGMIYAPPGAGKTTLFGTAQRHPNMQHVLFIDVEGGLSSVSHIDGILYERVGKDDAGKPNHRTCEDLERIFWSLVNKEKGYEKIQTVVIDSGTELQGMDLQDIVMSHVNDPKHRRDNPDLLEQRDYMLNTSRLKRIFRLFRDADFHFFVSALTRKIEDDKGNMTEMAPHFTQKLGETLMGYMDFVWFMYVDKDGNRKMLTQPKGPYKAKTRGQEFAEAIGAVVENPTMPELYELYLKSGNTNKKK